MIFWISTCASRLARALTIGAISSALALASAAAIASPSATLISASFEYLAKPAMASASVTPDLITSFPRYCGNRLSEHTCPFRTVVRVRVDARVRVWATFVESQFGSSISLKALSGSSAALAAAGHTVISISTGMKVSISTNPSVRILLCTSLSAESSSLGLSICTSLSPLSSISASLAAARSSPPMLKKKTCRCPAFPGCLNALW